jgi:hypothetical protein
MHKIAAAFRQLRKSPGFSVTVILTIAPGIWHQHGIFRQRRRRGRIAEDARHRLAMSGWRTFCAKLRSKIVFTRHSRSLEATFVIASRGCHRKRRS